MIKKRVVVYVDGFNLYHSIKALNRPHLKWLDLKKLAQRLINDEIEQLVGVKYYSAYATHLSDPYKRHKIYTRALKATGTQIIMGRFQKKTKRCKACREEYNSHEEKETDTNIAVDIVTDAFEEKFDICILISRDSDFIPPIKYISSNFPNKQVRIFAAPRAGHSHHLKKLVGDENSLQINIGDLDHAQLDDEIFDQNGKKIAYRPQKYIEE